MRPPSLNQLYEQHIKPLPSEERLALIERIARDLAAGNGDASPAGRGPRSILELEALGAEIWSGIDAQRYVNDLRNEWDRES